MNELGLNVGARNTAVEATGRGAAIDENVELETGRGALNDGAENVGGRVTIPVGGLYAGAVYDHAEPTLVVGHAGEVGGR